jgi:hypothetical protein
MKKNIFVISKNIYYLCTQIINKKKKKEKKEKQYIKYYKLDI